ncbi:MAG: endolytic transglycosylase MltG [Burkholderiales bacterium]
MPFSPRRLVRRLLTLLALLAAAGGGSAAWYVTTALTMPPAPVEFEIPAGAGLRATAHVLARAGVAVHPFAFEMLARSLGRAQAIKAGNYELTGPTTPTELLDKLTRGAVMQAELRIIEGWTFGQLRAALNESPVLRHDTASLGDEQILARLGAPEKHAEGLFFPDTYLFARQSSDLAVLRRAYHAMQRHLAEEWAQRADNVPYKSPYEALVMASIVEKETGRPDERGLIAGVLVNRLRVRMALQADPTVIYGLGGEFNGNLKRAHLTADGPYNTYTRPGLPPTPIALPGLASIRAALRPDPTKALYYVSRGDGSSEFSSSLQEHNRAVDRYQRHPSRK